MAVTGYTIDALDNFTREELPAVIHESLPELDPIYNWIQTTSLGVQRDRIGRDWEVEHLYGTGVAGLIQHADPRGPAMLDRAEYYQAQVLDSTSGALAPFPNAVNAPHNTSLLRILSLHKSVGNFNIPLTWLQGEALGANQLRQVTRTIAGVGQLRALTEATSFFMASNNCLGQIETWTDDQGTTTAAAAVKVTITPGTGRIQFFRVGMMVDIVVDSAGTPQFGSATDGSDRRNYVTTYGYTPLIVADVDYLGGTITLSSINNTDISSDGNYLTSAAAGDWIVLRDNVTASREMRTWGLNDWIASSGQILGGSATVGNRLNPGLDLDTQSQFKSLVKAVNGPMTDEVMNQYIGKFIEAYQGASLDTLLTTMGVQLEYIKQPSVYNNRMFFDRTGKALDYMGGWDIVGYSFGGKKFRWVVSNMCLNGNLYGLKMNGGNIKRYIPPAIGGSDARIGSEVEFIAPLGGSNSIFMLARNSSGQVMDMLEAPFMEYVLIAPIDVRSVRLTGLSEAI